MSMQIFEQFDHLNLSKDQQSALGQIERFLKGNQDVFLLKGYAGSGKTTILKGLTAYLRESHRPFSLMAPTGRAAKILRDKSGEEASTVHRAIYSYNELEPLEEGESFRYYFKIKSVDQPNHVYIVDEASMVSDAVNEGEFFRFGSGRLLSDLVVFSELGKKSVNNKIIFVGDPCQLPPVGDNGSKALQASYLEEKFSLQVVETEMREVRRQGNGSAILQAAGKIRQGISSGYFNDFHLKPAPGEITAIPYAELLDTWKGIKESKIIIAYKNKTCLQLNKSIREMKYGQPDLPLQARDWLIFGGNNYTKGVFNGEFAYVNQVSPQPVSRTVFFKSNSDKPVTLTWRKVELLVMSDKGEAYKVEGQILENFLLADQNQVSAAEMRALYVDFCKRHPTLRPKSEEFKMAIREDGYFNCLLVKYGYAITCHKSQGGEWKNVITIWDNDVRPGFDCFTAAQSKAGKTNEGFFRWAYTAITRSSERLFLLNPPKFNPYATMVLVDDKVKEVMAELAGSKQGQMEVLVDAQLQETLEKLGLQDQNLPVQDHCLAVIKGMEGLGVELTKWERKQYEICYYFQKGEQQAGVKTWINGKDKFKGTFQILPKSTTSMEFGAGLVRELQSLPMPTVVRTALQAVVTQFEFDMQVQENFPFLHTLYENLSQELPGLVLEVEHLSYQDRYTFRKGGEQAVFDFGYDGKGFFGLVNPVLKLTNSSRLVNEVSQAVDRLKAQD